MKSKHWFHENGPTIGILTARNKNGFITGNAPLFIHLQKKLISQKGISFVFTLDGVNEDYVDGYTYNPEINIWEGIKAPFPDLVYNRIPFRRTEQDPQYQQFLDTLGEKNVPYFNPCFVDKFELYSLFKDHHLLHSYLPKTILANQKRVLASFIREYKSIYLKPSQAARGTGIFRLEIDQHMAIHLEGILQQQTYLSFQHFWREWETELIEKDYLAQEEIQSSKYDGSRFDFRILAHADHDRYTVTGVGIRQSQEQGITTHIPRGGKLLPYPLIQTEEHDRFIQQIVDPIGKEISKRYGFFGEFSIDAGVSQTGRYYIYEVNSKPMSFDEAEIEERRVTRLCKLFLQLCSQFKD
ncbi:YheC/YheD family endospore coat-associated protein [Neobacillus sp. K501]